MEEKKLEKTDKYMLVLMSLFYIYLYIKNVVGAAMHVTGWDWLAFIVLAVIALFFCFFAVLWVNSFVVLCITTTCGKHKYHCSCEHPKSFSHNCWFFSVDKS